MSAALVRRTVRSVKAWRVVMSAISPKAMTKSMSSVVLSANMPPSVPT